MVEKNRENLPNDKVAEGKAPKDSSEELEARKRKVGRWGFLPPKVREEMLSTSGKEVPPEYREIVEKYYKRISDFYERVTRSKK